MNLKLYCINDAYIDYLKKYENMVYDNKIKSRTFCRKYIGILQIINGYIYFIPITSPKKSDFFNYDKKIIRKDTLAIIRIKKNNDLFGAIKICNMIPVPIFETIEYNPSYESDEKYKYIIFNELRFINDNKHKIIRSANALYKQKLSNNNKLDNVNNFKLLEEKCDEWTKKNITFI